MVFDAAGIFKDSSNPQAWIKGGFSIAISAIPGLGAAKGITKISKVPWKLMKDSTIYNGGDWVVINGINDLPTGIGNSVTWDFNLNYIMNYLGVPNHVYYG